MQSREAATVILVAPCVLLSNTAITRKPASGDPPAIDPTVRVLAQAGCVSGGVRTSTRKRRGKPVVLAQDHLITTFDGLNTWNLHTSANNLLFRCVPKGGPI